MSTYNFTVQDHTGNEISLDQYRGKVLLIVNTASKCGFTPQYQGLEELYQKYKNHGFEILAFPCKQFGGQEFESNEEIQSFCQVNYNVSFPVMARIDVNGPNAHPLYQYLRKSHSGILGERIKWNFTKFLIDSNGNVLNRYAPTTTPEKIEADIEKLLTR